MERMLERSASGKKGMKSRWNKNDDNDNSVNNSVNNSAITEDCTSVIAVENENDNISFKKKKKVELPTNYSLSPEHIKYALDNKIPEHMIETLFEDFCIHHRKNGNKFVNWYAAWQTWVRNDKKFYPDKYKSAVVSTPNQPHYMTAEEMLSD